MKSQSHLLALIFASSLVVACMAVSTAARGEVDAPLVERSVIQTLLKDSGAHGGLVVHVGCGSGEESATLAAKAEKPFVVQGLEGDREALEKARKCARELGVSGELTFKHWDGDTLPYTDNLVNVLFWEPAEKEANMDEIMRVLAPGGVAYVQQEDGWHEEVKPWPDTIDDWSHHRYNAGNVGASNDEEVGPPTHIQWEAGPRFMRSHEIETGFSSLVSAKGRIYYIIDDGPIGITDARFPSRWSLMARDAFNGVELWKRPLPEWGWQAWREGRENNPHEWLGSRTNPGDVDRSMAVDGDTLYVILGWGEPISAVDGATGDVLNTYEETAGTIEFVVHEGVLLVREQNPDPAIKAVNPGDGEVLWRTEASLIADRSLCAAAERVFFSTRSEMVALALDTGDELWRTETGIRPSGVMANEEALLAVVSDVTLALSAETGEVLWEGPGAGTRGRNLDLFLIGDLAWWHRHNAHARRLDDGEEVRRLHLQSLLESGHHRRCYTDRATVNYLITGERGSEFMHLADENHMRHNWTRGPCISGMTPANGLFYVPPHQCFCYSAVRLDGFFALASRADSPGIDAGGGERLERGPAYGEALAESESDGEQWPTYRQNAERSGSVASDVPSELARAWSTQLGGDLTQAVAAGGRVYVAEKKAGTLHCLDMENGVRLWSRTVAGAIDSPPSVHNGHVIFGSRDGFVYSLRATDGELAWRFRAAPEDRQVMSHDRLEAAWPLHGSVLILDGLVYAAAGRSGFLDGGVYLYALDPVTGDKVHENKLEGPYPDISEPSPPFYKNGHRADLLTTDGEHIYMGRTVLDQALEEVQPEIIPLVGTQRGDEKEYRKMPGMRLVATGGFMNETFFNRTWWMYSYAWPSYHYAQQAPKSGQMLVFDEDHTYTVKHYTTRNRHSPMFFPGDGYLLFADDNENEPLFYRGEGEPEPIEWEPELPEETRWSIYQDAAVDKGPGFTRAEPSLWTSWHDVRVEAMALAGGNLFVAGPPDEVPLDDPLAALDGRMGAILRVVSTDDGNPIKDYTLASRPVFDGLSAAQGKLLIVTEAGEVICMAAAGV